MMASRNRADWRPPRRCRPAAATASKSPPPAPTTREPFPYDVDALLHRCGPPEPLPMGGAFLRGALTESEQRYLYEALYSMAPDSDDFEALRQTSTPQEHALSNPDNKPMYFAYHLMPYTRLSNVKQKPKRLLEWAQRLMHALAPGSSSHKIDSMLSQLYASGGGLKKHRDADLSWGIIVSLGSTAAFDCWDEKGKQQRLMVRSGDVVVGEFGQMEHAVAETSNEPLPSWWRDVDHFGCRVRCSILFRQALTEKQQRKIAERRAKKLHGCSIAELSRQTGKPEEFLSGLLCRLHSKGLDD